LLWDVTGHIGPLLLQDREKPGHKIEVDEEYEDAEGNVYNRKTFEDLRRQGLI
jgi:splicing factor 3A subunit 3